MSLSISNFRPNAIIDYSIKWDIWKNLNAHSSKLARHSGVISDKIVESSVLSSSSALVETCVSTIGDMVT